VRAPALQLPSPAAEVRLTAQVSQKHVGYAAWCSCGRRTTRWWEGERAKVDESGSTDDGWRVGVVSMHAAAAARGASCARVQSQRARARVMCACCVVYAQARVAHAAVPAAGAAAAAAAVRA
jgi:hypothetical protein